VIVISALAIGGCAASEGGIDNEGSSGSGASAGSGGGSGAGSGGSAGSGWGSGGSAGSAAGSGGGGGSPAIDGGGAGGSAGSGGVPTGNETLCDDIDNDQNGVIDDVDKGKDGICDCLKIATLGLKGKWGQGNVFANWLATRSDFGAVDLGTQVLSDALIAPYDVIVAQDLSTKGGVFGGLGGKGYDATEVAALQAWISGGGGLMTLAGYEDPYSVGNVNTLLAPLGMSYGTSQILQNSGSTVPVGGWILHPATDGVSLIGVGNGYEVFGPGSMIANQAGYDVLQAHTVGSGRVLMWADEWITYDTEWTSNPQYQVELFWLNIIKWLSPSDICQVPIPPSIK
jgi:hypothetical protein